MTGVTRKPRRDLEFQHQSALVAWAAHSRARYPELKWLHASLNGVKLSKAQAGKAKAAGMKAGILDLMLPVRRPPYSGLYIEMKAGKNTTTEAQDEFIAFASEQGFKCVVCWSWEDARDELLSYLSGHKLFASTG